MAETLLKTTEVSVEDLEVGNTLNEEKQSSKLLPEIVVD